MIIDAHAHLVPQDWYHPKSPQAIFDIPRLRDEQQRAGVDLTIFGNNWIRTPAGKDPYDIVTEFNAFAAETTAKHSDFLLGLACAVPFGGDKFLKETERAVREYGLKGIMINSSVAGEYLDSPNAVPFFELVTDLDVPLFVHPPRVTIGAEHMEIFPAARNGRTALRHHPVPRALHPHRRLRAVPGPRDDLFPRGRRPAHAARTPGLRLRAAQGRQASARGNPTCCRGRRAPTSSSSTTTR